MKKKLMIILILSNMLAAAACNKGGTINTKASLEDPGTVPGQSLASPEEGEDENDTAIKEEKDGGPVDTLVCQDFYPLKSDTEYVYEGQGMEFASYITHIDYIDPAAGRMQTRTNNGGTETVRVLEFKEGKLYLIHTVSESYYRDDLLDIPAEEDAEILLMEPLIPGTSWTLPDGRKRYISASDVELSTPTGKYRTLEVTTESEFGVSKDYYARYTGLVKSVFSSEGYEITSTLSSMKHAPLTKDILSTPSILARIVSSIWISPLHL